MVYDVVCSITYKYKRLYYILPGIHKLINITENNFEYFSFVTFMFSLSCEAAKYENKDEWYSFAQPDISSLWYCNEWDLVTFPMVLQLSAFVNAM